MTCNVRLKDGVAEEDDDEQDQWTPYLAFCQHYPKQVLSSWTINPKFPEKDIGCITNSFLSWPIHESYEHLKEKSSWQKLKLGIKDSVCSRATDEDDTSSQKNCTAQSFWDCILPSTRSAKLWETIVGSCNVKKKMSWFNSLENRHFISSLRLSYKAGPDIQDSSIWSFKCGCYDKRYQEKRFEKHQEGSDASDQVFESDEECNSPCCCPKYFTSEHGVVFHSKDEKDVFDEKMAKMNELLETELTTIREQHDRLQKTCLKEKFKENIASEDSDEMEGQDMINYEPGVDQNGFNKETQERSKYGGIFSSLKGLLNNLNLSQDASDRREESVDETASKIVDSNQLCDQLISTLKDLEAKLG